MNEDTALCIDRCLLPVVICSIKELTSRGVHCGKKGQPLLDRFPFGKRVDSDTVPSQARDIELRAVLFFHKPTERGRYLQPALGIDSCRVVSSKHAVPAKGPTDACLNP